MNKKDDHRFDTSWSENMGESMLRQAALEYAKLKNYEMAKQFVRSITGDNHVYGQKYVTVPALRSSKGNEMEYIKKDIAHDIGNFLHDRGYISYTSRPLGDDSPYRDGEEIIGDMYAFSEDQLIKYTETIIKLVMEGNIPSIRIPGEGTL